MAKFREQLLADLIRYIIQHLFSILHTIDILWNDRREFACGSLTFRHLAVHCTSHTHTHKYTVPNYRKRISFPLSVCIHNHIIYIFRTANTRNKPKNGWCNGTRTHTQYTQYIRIHHIRTYYTCRRYNLWSRNLLF